jgi:hypothetical protein
MMVTVLFRLSVPIVFRSLCNADTSLRGALSDAGVSPDAVSVDEVQRSLLEEINVALKSTGGVQKDRLQELEGELSTMYAALPKNENGFLGHAPVHYALHRLFMERHGWFFSGLEPAGAAWNSLTPAVVLKDRVPAYVQDLFEQQLGGRGFGLQELAVLAATLEHLVRNEATLHLQDTFQLLELPLEGKLTKDQFDEVLDTYFLMSIVKANFTATTKDQVSAFREKVKDVLPEWPEIQIVLRDQIVKYGSRMDFDAAAEVVSQTSQQLGAWHKGRCQSTKDRLVNLGDRQIGRVQLSSFYTDALARYNQQGGRRAEHIDYLRELGALEESPPNRASLLVANYINSRSNCFAVSSFYSVCCANECEGLLRHLEWEIAEPAASPDRIHQLVKNLPSSTVGAPRELKEQLVKRLDDIATRHDGKVPIHGRLFAQWLHHAYPRECPYPHSVGTTRPQTADAWMEEKGRDSTHTQEEIEEHLRMIKEIEVPSEADLDTEELPWSDEEELLTKHSPCGVASTVTSVSIQEVSHERSPLGQGARYIVFLLALSAMFWVVSDKATGMTATLRHGISAGLKGVSSPKMRQHLV